MDDAGLADLLATPGFLALAQQGGAALLVMTEAGATLQDFGGAFAPSSGGALPDGLAQIDLGSMAGETGSTSPEKLAAAAEQLASALDASTAASELVLVASASPDGAAEAAGITSARS